MRVLVLGASGASGGRVVERALACGFHVTAFARNTDNVGIEHSRLSLAAGDVTDAAAVELAMPDHDAVVWAIGGQDRFRDPRGASRRSGLCTVGTTNVLAAMGRRGARRLICQSSWGVADSYQRAPLFFRWVIFPLLLRDELADKGDQERLIRASNVDWTIVRPARLTNAPGTGRYRAGPQLAFSARAHVARADVAELIVRELDEPRFIGQTIEISA